MTLIANGIDTNTVQLLEQLAFNTWPAAMQWRYGDWTVRCSGAFTKRANSVFTAGPLPGHDGWLEEIETFYKRQDLPPQFHLSPASPVGLDELLERCGYNKDTVTSVYIADCRAAAESLPGTSRLNTTIEVLISDQPNAAWIGGFLEAEGFPEARRPFYEGLFARIAPRSRFITVVADGRTAGLGTVVIERGWAGFINVVTHPAFRGQGIGKQIVQQLAAEALLLGAQRLYLQVVADNAPAIALYQKLGFTWAYDYHYRVKSVT
ncbi:GNAT family N-acetyltransferase [Paenibacillus thalictri]|nr:GNAT family N-acetyltransferase [Paenibacillus thalictri]